MPESWTVGVVPQIIATELTLHETENLLELVRGQCLLARRQLLTLEEQSKMMLWENYHPVLARLTEADRFWASILSKLQHHKEILR